MLKLTADQVEFLKAFTAYKAAYRKDGFERDQRFSKSPVSKSYDELAKECLELGILKADKNGRLSLKLGWEKTRQLMAAQTDTVASLTLELESLRQALLDNGATIARLAPLNPPWPSTDHYALKDAREQLVYLNGKVQDVNEQIGRAHV